MAAMETLKSHLTKTHSKSSYAHSPVVPLDIVYSNAELGPPAVFANVIKYLSRYMAVGGDKARNPEDLLKAAHYILIEYARISQSLP